MAQKKVQKNNALIYILLLLNIMTLVIAGILLMKTHTLARDSDLNRLKHNLLASRSSNLEHCYIKGDHTCPPNKYVDSRPMLKELQDFLDKN